MKKITITILGIIYISFACFIASDNKTTQPDCINQVKACGVIEQSVRTPSIPEMVDGKPVKYQMPPQIINTEQELKFKPNCMLFWCMEGCPPCKEMKLIVTKLIGEGYDIHIFCVEKYPVQAERMGVTAFPTIIIRGNDKEVKRFIGLTTEHQIKKYLKHNEADYDIF